jgi:hypothetical protein
MESASCCPMGLVVGIDAFYVEQPQGTEATPTTQIEGDDLS